MPDVKDLIAAARLPERTVPLCLRADLAAAHEAAERRLTEALRAPGATSLEDADPAVSIAREIESLAAQMADSTVIVRLRALTRPAWRALTAQHPPRRDDAGEVHEQDRFVSINFETFPEAIVRACVVEPDLDEQDWARLLNEVLTDQQFDRLFSAAWALNRGDVNVPFSRAASQVLRPPASE